MMRKNSWILQLSELQKATICYGNLNPLAPDNVTCRFVASGHLIEYVEVGPGGRLPILFYGPDEFAVRSHPGLTQFEVIDDASLEMLTHGEIIRLLRNFPDTANHYKEMRRRYREKVMERLKIDRMKTPMERYHYVRKKQGWIFSLAKHKDIACYLGISLPEWMDLKGKR